MGAESMAGPAAKPEHVGLEIPSLTLEFSETGCGTLLVTGPKPEDMRDGEIPIDVTDFDPWHFVEQAYSWTLDILTPRAPEDLTSILIRKSSVLDPADLDELVDALGQAFQVRIVVEAEPA